MPMELDFFTPRTLTGVINLRPIKWDLFTGFFKAQTPSPDDVFLLETSLRGASILPSITNYDAGTMRRSETLTVDYVKAPRFRPKRAFRAADLLKTQKGLTPYDPRINPVERAIADDMDAHRDDIDRMLEIMCAQAAVDGKIVLYDMIEGQIKENYIVDFKRPASHDVKLTGKDVWSDPESDLLGCIEEKNLLIQEDTSGLSGTDLILGKTPGQRSAGILMSRIPWTTAALKLAIFPRVCRQSSREFGMASISGHITQPTRISTARPNIISIRTARFCLLVMRSLSSSLASLLM